MFIDIDGVFLPQRAAFLPGQDLASPRLLPLGEGDPAWPANYAGRRWSPVRRKLDPVAVSLVRRLVTLSGARLVASSSWRSHPAAGRQAIEKAFCEAGWNIADAWHADWSTPVVFSSERMHEISSWLEDHPETERWVAFEDTHRIPAPGAVYVDAEEGISLANYRLSLMLLDVHDGAFGAGGGWPRWTEWGERTAVRRWLDHAYATPGRRAETLSALRRKWHEVSRTLHGDDWHRAYAEHRETERARLEEIDAHADQLTGSALQAEDPWTAPGGASAFLEDQRSIERRILELRDHDRREDEALAALGFGAITGRQRRRPSLANQDEP